MLKSLLLWLTLGLALIAESQTIIIKDYETGEPLEMVTIVSGKNLSFTTTNADGEADISNFSLSEKVEIRSLGYKTKTLQYKELEKKNFQVWMHPSILRFDEIVVSATRWSQASRNIPSKISIISSKQIALQNPQTAADLLAGSGEVFIQKSQQGGGSPMIRGFSANRLLYTVDGIRMNTAIFRAGNLQNVISLDPFTIESSEVLFGPGSIIYGSDAIGGVMSFRTLTPSFSLSKEALIGGNAISRFSSANQELSNHFDVQVGWKKFASITSFTYSRFNDLKMGKYGPEEYLKPYVVNRVDSVDRVFTNEDPSIQAPSGYSQMNIMQKFSYRPSAKWDVQYGFHFSETSGFSRYDRLIETQSNGLPKSAVWNYGPQVWSMNNITAIYSESNSIFDQLSVRLAHQYFQESRIDRKFQHYLLRTQKEEVNAYSVNADFERKRENHTFYYGLEYIRNDVASTASAIDIRDGLVLPVPDRYPASEWNSYAAYINYQFDISESYLFQAGVRYATFGIESDFTRHLEFYPFEFTQSSLNNSATTGSIGLIYRPEETWKISINASTGFRAPNVDDIGKIFDFASQEVVVPNANLKAEYAYNAEFNISKVFMEIVKVDFTGFYTFLDHAMVRREFQVNGQDSILYNDEMSKVYAIQNAAYGTVYGFHGGVELIIPYGFNFSTRYNYQLGREEMDDGSLSRSRHAAPGFGTSRFSYGWKNLSMQIYAIYSSEVSHANLNEEEKQKPFIYASDSNGNPYSPRWYTLNFKAMYQFHEHFSLSAGIENLTNQRYRPYSSGLVAPGRNMILSMRVLF